MLVKEKTGVINWSLGHVCTTTCVLSGVDLSTLYLSSMHTHNAAYTYEAASRLSPAAAPKHTGDYSVKISCRGISPIIFAFWCLEHVYENRLYSADIHREHAIATV